MPQPRRNELIIRGHDVCYDDERLMTTDGRYYERRAQQLLELLAAATDRSVEAIQLNKAAQYAV